MVGTRSVIAMTLLMMAVMATVNGQQCDVGNLGDRCICEEEHPGTFKVTCSCNSQEAFTISRSDTSSLPPTVTGFHIHNCNSSVVITSNAFELFDNLENITFSSITNLKLESNSLNIVAIHRNDFSLTFDTILGLSFEENAVKIQGEGGELMRESLVIQNTFILRLPQHAINGSFDELLIKTVILAGEAGSGAIDVGKVGAKVTLDIVDASTRGLGSEWLTGYVQALTITNSTLDMRPRAFAGVKMRGNPKLEITVSNNRFGYPRWNVGSPDTHSEISLPSGVFDMDLEGPIVSVTSENNLITCSCPDLTWLLERPQNDLKNNLKFVCIQGNLATALEKCRSSVEQNASATTKSIFSIILSFALMVIL